jgi:hypothetical protein
MPRTAHQIALMAVIALSAFALGFVSAPKTGPALEYAGVGRCKTCHIDRHKSWKQDPHGTAFERLAGDYQKDPVCLKCHTTGYGEGGFTSLEDTPDLVGVQCEQCHGAGEEHIPLMSQLKKDKVDPSEFPKDLKISKRPATCIKCHSPHEEHVPFDR